MSGTCCFALGCSNRKGNGISFHRFPKNEKRQKQWAAALKRDNFEVSAHSRICADHFEESCFDRTGQTIRLKDTAVPTIFNFPAHLQKMDSEADADDAVIVVHGTTEETPFTPSLQAGTHARQNAFNSKTERFLTRSKHQSVPDLVVSKGVKKKRIMSFLLLDSDSDFSDVEICDENGQPEGQASCRSRVPASSSASQPVDKPGAKSTAQGPAVRKDNRGSSGDFNTHTGLEWTCEAVCETGPATKESSPLTDSDASDNQPDVLPSGSPGERNSDIVFEEESASICDCDGIHRRDTHTNKAALKHTPFCSNLEDELREEAGERKKARALSENPRERVPANQKSESISRPTPLNKAPNGFSPDARGTRPQYNSKETNIVGASNQTRESVTRACENRIRQAVGGQKRCSSPQTHPVSPERPAKTHRMVSDGFHHVQNQPQGRSNRQQLSQQCPSISVETERVSRSTDLTVRPVFLVQSSQDGVLSVSESYTNTNHNQEVLRLQPYTQHQLVTNDSDISHCAELNPDSSENSSGLRIEHVFHMPVTDSDMAEPDVQTVTYPLSFLTLQNPHFQTSLRQTTLSKKLVTFLLKSQDARVEVCGACGDNVLREVFYLWGKHSITAHNVNGVVMVTIAELVQLSFIDYHVAGHPLMSRSQYPAAWSSVTIAKTGKTDFAVSLALVLYIIEDILQNEGLHDRNRARLNLALDSPVQLVSRMHTARHVHSSAPSQYTCSYVTFKSLKQQRTNSHTEDSVIESQSCMKREPDELELDSALDRLVYDAGDDEHCEKNASRDASTSECLESLQWMYPSCSCQQMSKQDLMERIAWKTFEVEGLQNRKVKLCISNLRVVRFMGENLFCFCEDGSVYISLAELRYKNLLPSYASDFLTPRFLSSKGVRLIKLLEVEFLSRFIESDYCSVPFNHVCTPSALRQLYRVMDQTSGKFSFKKHCTAIFYLMTLGHHCPWTLQVTPPVSQKIRRCRVSGSRSNIRSTWSTEYIDGGGGTSPDYKYVTASLNKALQQTIQHFKLETMARTFCHCHFHATSHHLYRFLSFDGTEMSHVTHMMLGGHLLHCWKRNQGLFVSWAELDVQKLLPGDVSLLSAASNLMLREHSKMELNSYLLPCERVFLTTLPTPCQVEGDKANELINIKLLYLWYSQLDHPPWSRLARKTFCIKLWLHRCPLEPIVPEGLNYTNPVSPSSSAVECQDPYVIDITRKDDKENVVCLVSDSEEGSHDFAGEEEVEFSASLPSPPVTSTSKSHQESAHGPLTQAKDTCLSFPGYQEWVQPPHDDGGVCYMDMEQCGLTADSQGRGQAMPGEEDSTQNIPAEADGHSTLTKGSQQVPEVTARGGLEDERNRNKETVTNLPEAVKTEIIPEGDIKPSLADHQAPNWDDDFTSTYPVKFEAGEPHSDHTACTCQMHEPRETAAGQDTSFVSENTCVDSKDTSIVSKNNSCEDTTSKDTLLVRMNFSSKDTSLARMDSSSKDTSLARMELSNKDTSVVRMELSNDTSVVRIDSSNKDASVGKMDPSSKGTSVARKNSPSKETSPVRKSTSLVSKGIAGTQSPAFKVCVQPACPCPPRKTSVFPRFSFLQCTYTPDLNSFCILQHVGQAIVDGKMIFSFKEGQDIFFSILQLRRAKVLDWNLAACLPYWQGEQRALSPHERVLISEAVGDDATDSTVASGPDRTSINCRLLQQALSQRARGNIYLHEVGHVCPYPNSVAGKVQGRDFHTKHVQAAWTRAFRWHQDFLSMQNATASSGPAATITATQGHPSSSSQHSQTSARLAAKAGHGEVGATVFLRKLEGQNLPDCAADVEGQPGLTFVSLSAVSWQQLVCSVVKEEPDGDSVANAGGDKENSLVREDSHCERERSSFCGQAELEHVEVMPEPLQQEEAFHPARSAAVAPAYADSLEHSQPDFAKHVSVTLHIPEGATIPSISQNRDVPFLSQVEDDRNVAAQFQTASVLEGIVLDCSCKEVRVMNHEKEVEQLLGDKDSWLSSRSLVLIGLLSAGNCRYACLSIGGILYVNWHQVVDQLLSTVEQKIVFRQAQRLHAFLYEPPTFVSQLLNQHFGLDLSTLTSSPWVAVNTLVAIYNLGSGILEWEVMLKRFVDITPDSLCLPFFLLLRKEG